MHIHSCKCTDPRELYSQLISSCKIGYSSFLNGNQYGKIRAEIDIALIVATWVLMCKLLIAFKLIRIFNLLIS